MGFELWNEEVTGLKTRHRKYNDVVIGLYGDTGSQTCGEHSIIYKEVESQCCTPKAGVALQANSTQIKKQYYIRREIANETDRIKKM